VKTVLSSSSLQAAIDSVHTFGSAREITILGPDAVQNLRSPACSAYRTHGLLEHPAPNIEPGDVVVVADGRAAIVTARVEAEPGWGQLIALLEVAIAPTPLTSDESIA